MLYQPPHHHYVLAFCASLSCISYRKQPRLVVLTFSPLLTTTTTPLPTAKGWPGGEICGRAQPPLLPLSLFSSLSTPRAFPGASPFHSSAAERTGLRWLVMGRTWPEARNYFCCERPDSSAMSRRQPIPLLICLLPFASSSRAVAVSMIWAAISCRLIACRSLTIARRASFRRLVQLAGLSPNLFCKA